MRSGIHERVIKEVVVDGGGSVTIASSSSCGDAIYITGKGKITYDNGDVYEGEFQETEPHGPGKLAYNDGYYFHSRFGVSGSGVAEGIWKEGDLDYKGDVDKNGKPHGRGEGMFSSNTTYEGEWKNGSRHGKGITKRGDRSVEYDGEFKNNMYHGEGTYYFENGDVYTGQWRASNYQGKGVMTYANQDQEIYTHDGEWEKNLKDGRGKLTFYNGDVYEGEFSNDKMHGKGAYAYACGRKERSVECLKTLSGSRLASKSTMRMMKSNRTQT